MLPVLVPQPSNMVSCPRSSRFYVSFPLKRLLPNQLTRKSYRALQLSLPQYWPSRARWNRERMAEILRGYLTESECESFRIRDSVGICLSAIYSASHISCICEYQLIFQVPLRCQYL